MTKNAHRAKAVAPRSNANLAHAKMIAAMLDAPQSSASLTAIGAMNYQTTRIFIVAMHKAGAIHIAEWGKNAPGSHVSNPSARVVTGWHPLYCIGRKDDTPKPMPESREVATGKQRARRAADAELRGVPIGKKRGPKPGTPSKRKGIPVARWTAPAPAPTAAPAGATRLVGNLWGTLQ